LYCFQTSVMSVFCTAVVAIRTSVLDLACLLEIQA
jgi:hypothetical protein